MEHSNKWMVKAIYVDDMDAVLSLWSEFIFLQYMYTSNTAYYILLFSVQKVKIF